MHNVTTKVLKMKFQKLFPEYAVPLDKAKTQEEIYSLREMFLAQAQANLRSLLQKNNIQLTDGDLYPPIALTNELYNTLINTTGNDIEEQIKLLLENLQELKDLENKEEDLLAAQMLLGGMIGISDLSVAEVIKKVMAGSPEFAAAVAGIHVATASVIISIITIAVISIIIPIIYFVVKPAACIVIVINELDKEINFKDDFNVHGKPVLHTQNIKISPAKKEDKIFVSGLVSTEKKEGALVGTQYGFTYTYDGIDISFGVSCPLTDIPLIGGKNACYCDIGSSSQDVAQQVGDNESQEWVVAKNSIKASITCNSPQGSHAFYVARIYR
ncbi:hypothetical protein [Xenorhabdus anantnagensis]|uniref:Uncharacterized protein n=1 Tax=Xenorhabdus anantnagensis TaxID=3025875 RepID=A0ABT5LVU7_9GAMM|nr:hypothetical protein [Xenorhabdus anantnagensis]MDC9598558.1 hypothetical protein [Xenorhabdus anantnagensis]